MARIVYVGSFVFPDKNAAAHRVINNAKIMRDIGYDVTFVSVNYAKKGFVYNEATIEGFDHSGISLELTPINKIRKLLSASFITDVISSYDDVECVIAYNFSSVPLLKLKMYCNKIGAKCIADVTEWYGSTHLKFPISLVKEVDTFIRMRIIHKQMNGIIAISDFVEEYYSNNITVNIPPLVDKSSSKWLRMKSGDDNSRYRFIYAGSPSSEKENLTAIIETFTAAGLQNIELNIVGITIEQFKELYDFNCSIPDFVTFHGRVSHLECLDLIKSSHFSILLRPINRVTTAGFPTKFVESISLGVPVITNDNSNVKRYLSKDTNGFLLNNEKELTELKDFLTNIEKSDFYVNCDEFDYRRYIDKMSDFLEKVGV